MAKAPKHTKKRIYWNKEGTSANVFLLVGYCPETLEYYDALYKEAKKDFPNLKKEEVQCGRVTKSNTIQGYTLIRFYIHSTKKRKIPGYAEYSYQSDGTNDFCF